MKSRFIHQWLDAFLANHMPRSNSLLITIYGDAIAPHGGTVWLRSLIELVEPLGLNQRLVRTSVFRLSKEKWLVAEHIGRNSYYSLTATGHRRFEHAYRRIYDDPRQQWDGDWQVVFTGGGMLSPAQRDALRRELQWEGFGVIAPGVLAHPYANHESVLDILQGTGTHDKVVVIRGRTLGALSSRPLQELVRECWNLDAIAEGYKRFCATFRPVARAIGAARKLDPEQAFCVRTLLIHEFRRVQLRDPQLPAQLLPKDWPGDIARKICSELYLLTREQAERHLADVLRTADGPLPAAAPYFQRRFSGSTAGEITKEA